MTSGRNSRRARGATTISAASSSPRASTLSGGGKIARQKHAGKPAPHWVWSHRRQAWQEIRIQPWERHILHQAMYSLGLVCECPAQASPARMLRRTSMGMPPARIPKRLGKIERRMLREAFARAGEKSSAR